MTAKVRLNERMNMNRPGTILFEESTNLFCVIVDKEAWSKKLQADYPEVYDYFSKREGLIPVYAFGDMINLQIIDLCMGAPIPKMKGMKLWALPANSCSIIFHLSSAFSGFVLGATFGNHLLTEDEKEVYASVSRELAVFSHYCNLPDEGIIPQSINGEIAQLEETYRSLKIPVR